MNGQARQPIPGQRLRRWPWGRIFLIALGLVGVLLVGTFLGLSFWLRSYLHSDEFRGLISEKTSAFFRAEGQYMPFHWTGFSVYSDGYLARGTTNAIFTELRADQIRAEFYPRAVFHDAWQINDIEIQRFELTLGKSTNQPPAVATRPPTPRLPWVPSKLDLRRVRIQETNVKWAPAGQPGKLWQTRTTIVPEGPGWLIALTGGQLQQTNWPTLRVEEAKVRYRHPELFITDGQLKLGESENVNVTGQLRFDEPSTMDLLVKVSGVSITPFLPEDWRARLKGNAVGDAKVTARLDDFNTLKATGTLNLTSGQLEALPVLNRIAAFTRTQQFRQFALQKASADFTWTKPTLKVSRLVLESEGLIRVEGGFVVEQRILDGVFQVGVTPNSLRWLPGSQERVFTTERDGYVWTTMRLTGPVDNLKEDLSSRLIAAAGEEVIEGAKNAVGTAAGVVKEGAKSVLDFLMPLVP